MIRARLMLIGLAAFAGLALGGTLPPSLQPPKQPETEDPKKKKEKEEPNIGQLNDWITSNRQAEIRDGMFYLDAMSAKEPISVFRRDKTFYDTKAAFQFKVEQVGTGERAVGLIFGSTSGNSYFCAEIDRKTVTLYRVAPGQGRMELDRRGGFNRLDNTWYELKVECQGALIRVFFDNKFLFAFTAPQLQPGNVGFYANDGRAWVRRMDLDGKAARLKEGWKP